MTIGSAVVLKEAVIVVNGVASTVLLPKGTQGIVRAESGSLLDLAVDGVRYAGIPIASVEPLSAATMRV